MSDLIKRMSGADIDTEIQIFMSGYAEKQDIESGIKKLKEAGYRQLDCVRIIKSALGISLREADDLVLYSEGWASERNATINLRNAAFDAAKLLEGDGLIID